jgi:hypothetical protein
MVQGRRLGPVAGLLVQALQEADGVGDVGRGVERRLQAWKRVRVLLQVHLHAADINRANTPRLRPPHRRDRGRLAVEERPGAVHVGGPRPRVHRAAARVAPAALHARDGAQQAWGKGMDPLRRRDRLPA